MTQEDVFRLDITMAEETTALREIERLFDRMNRQIEQASRSFREGEPVSVFYGDTMPVDIIERDDEYHIIVDMPGFEKDDVSLQVTDHTLRIEAERTVSEEEEDENYVRRERSTRTMQRRVSLPDEVEGDAAKAKLEDGVLSITIPKVESAKARKVEIN